MAEFLSNDLEPVENLCYLTEHSLDYVDSVCMKDNCVLYLWCEEPLYPTGQERFVQYAADWGPLSRVAFKQLRQERAQFLGVVNRHGRVWATDDLQN